MPEKDPAISPECKGEVELDHVAFRYVPDRPLIKDLNLKVNSGERVAIVGPTGCGKTTIINLRRTKSIRPEIGARLLLTMDNQEKIIVSRQYAGSIKHALGVK